MGLWDEVIRNCEKANRPMAVSSVTKMGTLRGWIGVLF